MQLDLNDVKIAINNIIDVVLLYLCVLHVIIIINVNTSYVVTPLVG